MAMAIPDLAVINSASDTVSILLGRGDGTFQAAQDVAVGSNPHGVAVGDFNGDGRPDLAVTNGASNTVSILLNNTPPRLVNGLVSFVPLPETFETSPDTKGCPAGFAGTFRFSARLTNRPSSPSLEDLFVRVSTLTNGNLVQNAQGGPAGVGAHVPVPRKQGYADGVLAPKESVEAPLVICLKKRAPFRLLVDVVGNSKLQPLGTISVEALIDGRSQLMLRGNTAQWHHFDFAAPGREAFKNVPTVINGVAWFPVWPDQPDEENRDCDCVSDVFMAVDPPLPQAGVRVELKTIRSRVDTRIVQQPAAANNFTLIIEFDDNPPGGDDFYIAEIAFFPVE